MNFYFYFYSSRQVSKIPLEVSPSTEYLAVIDDNYRTVHYRRFHTILQWIATSFFTIPIVSLPLYHQSPVPRAFVHFVQKTKPIIIKIMPYFFTSPILFFSSISTNNIAADRNSNFPLNIVTPHYDTYDILIFLVLYPNNLCNLRKASFHIFSFLYYFCTFPFKFLSILQDETREFFSQTQLKIYNGQSR